VVNGIARIAIVRATRYTPVRKVDQVMSTARRAVCDVPIKSIKVLIKAAHMYGKNTVRILSAIT
jgi:hypothetical protein